MLNGKFPKIQPQIIKEKKKKCKKIKHFKI